MFWNDPVVQPGVCPTRVPTSQFPSPPKKRIWCTVRDYSAPQCPKGLYVPYQQGPFWGCDFVPFE